MLSLAVKTETDNPKDQADFCPEVAKGGFPLWIVGFFSTFLF